ncbi:unnamed protein product [Caenorhabditis auriculariae]|uniref:AB hydrolase-1 domain-containing protein n=1 Tax=Caenorhabditis auriculariae TaxID=2777116 RepID=A0A8S1HQS9_9PELO|nr:unnamed protein product [Caenorhabditis auriculariae]
MAVLEVPVEFKTISGDVVNLSACYKDWRPVSKEIGTVIAIHGSPGSHGTFRKFGDPLAKSGIRMIAINYPGFGCTPSYPNQSHRNEERMAFINGLIKALKITGKIVFMAHSRGTEDALSNAAFSKAFGLVLINPTGLKFNIFGQYSDFREKLLRLLRKINELPTKVIFAYGEKDPFIETEISTEVAAKYNNLSYLELSNDGNPEEFHSKIDEVFKNGRKGVLLNFVDGDHYVLNSNPDSIIKSVISMLRYDEFANKLNKPRSMEASERLQEAMYDIKHKANFKYDEWANPALGCVSKYPGAHVPTSAKFSLEAIEKEEDISRSKSFSNSGSKSRSKSGSGNGSTAGSRRSETGLAESAGNTPYRRKTPEKASSLPSTKKLSQMLWDRLEAHQKYRSKESSERSLSDTSCDSCANVRLAPLNWDEAKLIREPSSKNLSAKSSSSYEPIQPAKSSFAQALIEVYYKRASDKSARTKVVLLETPISNTLEELMVLALEKCASVEIGPVRHAGIYCGRKSNSDLVAIPPTEAKVTLETFLKDSPAGKTAEFTLDTVAYFKKVNCEGWDLIKRRNAPDLTPP